MLYETCFDMNIAIEFKGMRYNLWFCAMFYSVVGGYLGLCVQWRIFICLKRMSVRISDVCKIERTLFEYFYISDWIIVYRSFL